MKKLFSSCSFMALMVISLFACSRKHYPASSVTTQTNSIETKYTERDTTAVAPAAKTGLQIPLFNLLNLDLNKLSSPVNLGESTNKQAKAKALVLLDSNTKQPMLQVECECDSLAIAMKLRDKVQIGKSETVRVDTVIVKERFIPTIIKILAWIGGVAIAALIILIIYHLNRK